MNWLDIALLVLVAAYALSGYWQGFITGAFATAGLLAGGLAGVLLAPEVLGDADPSLTVSLGALFIVILGASLGQALLQYGGARIRQQITWQPARAVDAVGGAALSAAAVLLVAWALGVAVSGSRIQGVTPVVRSSAVLGYVDRALPQSASQVLRAFNSVVGTSFFPDYLEPFAPERIVEVGPGPQRLLTDPDVEAVANRIFKVRGQNSCGRGVEGTGFVYAPNRVMTNAHVVAGVDEPTVSVGEITRQARLVLYNSELDIAVLAFDGPGIEPLGFNDPGEAAQARDPVAILGYPQDGPYDVQPGRVRSQQNLRSANIYGTGTVIREVYSVRGLVRPGNSGGPIVSSAGDVVGMVFAASVTDGQTGYALTADQVSDAAARGRQNSETVSSGDCAS